MARVVVITGGGTGIGAACARLMRAAGDRVFITGRREAPLQAVADETGATALVGDAADKVEQRTVETGDTYGNKWLVLSGLKAS
ncbi:SDR family NAD(P)-dependent oxidoreductase, partial [Klebsiella pneumoniae]|uniref:SDR family NAD(P)-dependent oxidoreductase n=1 Tax=Klebsiella pneumoniae TaxID=573 RepID=UPI001FB6FE15